MAALISADLKAVSYTFTYFYSNIFLMFQNRTQYCIRAPYLQYLIILKCCRAWTPFFANRIARFRWRHPLKVGTQPTGICTWCGVTIAIIFYFVDFKYIHQITCWTYTIVVNNIHAFKLVNCVQFKVHYYVRVWHGRGFLYIRLPLRGQPAPLVSF